jgi:nitroreductase
MALSIEEVNQLKDAPVSGLLPALAHRWSPRSFQDTPVPPADLKLVLEAARWSASSSNLQPWRFFVGVKGSATYDKIHAALVPANQLWASAPNVLLLGFAEAKDSKGNPNRYALYDLGQAAAALTIQATALGLKAHSMGGFDHDAARKAFGLTEEHLLGATIAIGYQAEPSALANDNLLQREVAPRERKPLGTIALLALDAPFEF